MASPESKILEDRYAQLSATVAAHPDLPLDAVRALMDTVMSAVTTEPDGVTYREESAGGVGALWCVPPECADDRVILYTHGGGYLAGSAGSHRKLTGHLARAAGMRVLSLDYALAPEHPHPAASDDALTAYRWLRAQGYAAARIALAGDSAGGGLCTALVLRIREAGEELPGAVMPFSPWLDMELTGATMAASRGTGDIVSIDSLENLRTAFLQGGDPADPIASPLRADLTGFPPVLLHVGSTESLRSDSETFAARARDAGADVTLVVEPDMLHVWVFGAGRFPEADEAVARMGAWVRDKLGC